MSVHPALPPVLLTILALSVLGIAAAAWSRWWTAGGSRKAVKAGWRLAGLTAAAVLLVIAAVRPVIGDGARTLPAGAGDGEPNVFLLIDRSPTMSTDAVREDVTAIVDRYPNARIALVSFAAAPSLDWPLSQDTWGLRPTLAALRPYAATPDTVDRTNPAAASNLLRYQLISARQQFPLADNLVYYFGAGVSGPDSPPRDFVLADGSVDGGAVFGYGAARDEAALRAVAEQIGVPYTSDPASDVEELDAAKDVAPPTASAWATETYWIPALLAAVLILAEMFAVLRDIRRSRPGRLKEAS